VIAARSSIALGLATLMGCSASEPQSDCVVRIAELERERAEYVERVMPELQRLQVKLDNGYPPLESQGEFADFMTEIEFRENLIRTERLRCPEAPPMADPDAAPEVRMRDNAPDQ
jgi:hypothetical protein